MAPTQAGLATGRYCPILRPARSEQYRPTIAVKCQLVGTSQVKIWRGKEQIGIDDFNWKRARAVPWGPSIQVMAMMVYDDGDDCPFDLE